MDLGKENEMSKHYGFYKTKGWGMGFTRSSGIKGFWLRTPLGGFWVAPYWWRNG